MRIHISRPREEMAIAGMITLLLFGTQANGQHRGEWAEYRSSTNTALDFIITDMDNPAKRWVYEPATRAIVYAGSCTATSDRLKVEMAETPGAALFSFTVTNLNVDPKPPSPDRTYDLGSITLDRLPHWDQRTYLTLLISCQAFDDQHRIVAKTSREVAVGIRTDDALVIGYIEPDRIKLPLEPSPGVLAAFHSDGNYSSYWAPVYLSDIVEGDNFLDHLSLEDRHYILNWLFKFAEPKKPRTALVGDTNYLLAAQMADNTWGANEAKILAYATNANYRRNYKMLNHLQVKFLLDRYNAGFDKAGAVVVEHQCQTGITKNPVGLGEFPAQTGPANSENNHTLDFSGRVTSIADVSPNPRGITAFNYLESGFLDPDQRPSPLKLWTDIGCAISFNWDGGTQPSVITTMFPTFLEYQNGVYLPQKEVVQLPEPAAHFVDWPWPFGHLPTGWKSVSHTWVPGGNNGYADKVDPALRWRDDLPPYVQDYITFKKRQGTW